MRRKVLSAVAAVLLFNVNPASAGLFFEWLVPLEQLGPVPSAFGAAYNPPGEQNNPDFPEGWFELGFGSDFDFFNDPVFRLQSDSEQTGLAPVKLSLVLAGEVVLDEFNAGNTQFQIPGFLSYNIQSFDGTYSRTFDMEALFFNETSYSRTDSFFDSLEIGTLYGVSSLLASAPPVWIDATPIDPSSPGHSIVFNEATGDLTLGIVPELPTFLLLASGTAGMWLRRNRNRKIQ